MEMIILLVILCVSLSLSLCGTQCRRSLFCPFSNVNDRLTGEGTQQAGRVVWGKGGGRGGVGGDRYSLWLGGKLFTRTENLAH